MAKYVLRKEVLGKVPEIEINESEYLGLQQARKILHSAFQIEEVYDVLITTYLEFESKILTEAAALMVDRDYGGYYDFFKVRVQLNIRLMNLLTCARLYLDGLCRYA